MGNSVVKRNVKSLLLLGPFTGWTNGFQSQFLPPSSIIFIAPSSSSNEKNSATILFQKRRSTKNKNPAWKDEYWYNENIHTLGNIGLLGGLHAAVAPLSTKIIDILAYRGQDVREEIAKRLQKHLMESFPPQATNNATTNKFESSIQILDMGCGVGVSSRALGTAFQNGQSDHGNEISSTSTLVIGMDTSPQMLAMARIKDFEVMCLKHPATTNDLVASIKSSTKSRVEYVFGNVEQTGHPSASFHLVTAFFLFHEVPFLGRQRILREASRILRPGGILAITDISSQYEPTASMLKGEPYISEYQQNFTLQLVHSVESFELYESYYSQEIVQGHVSLYILKKGKSNTRSWWTSMKSWMNGCFQTFLYLE